MSHYKTRALRGIALSGVVLSVTLAGNAARAQVVNDPTQVGGIGSVIVEENGFTLNLVSQFDGLTAQTALNLERTFFATIPQEALMFNADFPHEVTVTVQPNAACGDPGTPGCTYTKEAQMEINGQWLVDHPEDYDVMTHEAMHVVQQYPSSVDACWYFREGLADVARAWYGVNNSNAGWQLEHADTYTEGYRKTADFLIWIGNSFGEGVLTALDALQRGGTCPADSFWQEQTALPLDALWQAYSSPGQTVETITVPQGNGEGV